MLEALCSVSNNEKKKKKDQQVQLFLKKITNMSAYACVSGWNWSPGIVDVAQDGFEL